MRVSIYDTPAQASFIDTFVPIKFDKLYEIASTATKEKQDAEDLLASAQSTYGALSTKSQVDAALLKSKVIDPINALATQAAESTEAMKTPEFRSKMKASLRAIQGNAQIRSAIENIPVFNKYLSSLDPRWNGAEASEVYGYDSANNGAFTKNPTPYVSVSDIFSPAVDELAAETWTDDKGIEHKGIRLDRIKGSIAGYVDIAKENPAAKLHLMNMSAEDRVKYTDKTGATNTNQYLIDKGLAGKQDMANVSSEWGWKKKADYQADLTYRNHVRAAAYDAAMKKKETDQVALDKTKALLDASKMKLREEVEYKSRSNISQMDAFIKSNPAHSGILKGAGVKVATKNMEGTEFKKDVITDLLKNPVFMTSYRKLKEAEAKREKIKEEHNQASADLENGVDKNKARRTIVEKDKELNEVDKLIELQNENILYDMNEKFGEIKKNTRKSYAGVTNSDLENMNVFSIPTLELTEIQESKWTDPQKLDIGGSTITAYSPNQNDRFVATVNGKFVEDQSPVSSKLNDVLNRPDVKSKSKVRLTGGMNSDDYAMSSDVTAEVYIPVEAVPNMDIDYPGVVKKGGRLPSFGINTATLYQQYYIVSVKTDGPSMRASEKMSKNVTFDTKVSKAGGYTTAEAPKESTSKK